MLKGGGLFLENILNMEILKNKIHYFKTKNTPILYTVKTNNKADILQQIHSLFNEKDKFGVFAINQIEALVDSVSSLNKKQIVFMNTKASNEVRMQAYDIGVRSFIFDDFELLKNFAVIVPEKIDIIIRLNVSEICDTTNPYGCSKADFKIIKDFMKLYGDFKVEVYFDRSIKLKYPLNKKGYLDIKNTLKKVLSYFEWNGSVLVGGISKLNFNDFTENDCKNIFCFEIGEGIIDGVQDTRCNITSIIKTDKGINLFVDNSIYNELLDKVLYKKEFKIQTNDFTTYNGSCHHPLYVRVYGNTCDSKDYIGSFIMSENDLDKLKIGNKIIIRNTGAYGAVFFDNYGKYCNDNN